MKDRIRNPVNWFPYPNLIAFAGVLTLTTHVSFGLNFKTGNPAQLLTFVGEESAETPIWFSITPIAEQIVVTTADRRTFSWPIAAQDADDILQFSNYLKEQVHAELHSSALAKTLRSNQIRATIAADQRLKFAHIRPILFALADSGITQYGFETINPVISSSTGSPDGH